MPVETIPQKVLDNGSRKADKPAYFVRGSGGWNPVSWATYAQEVTDAAKALMALGVELGRQGHHPRLQPPRVGRSWTSPRWPSGPFPPGIYTTNSPEECKYIITHSEAVVLLAEDEGQWNKIDAIRDQLPESAPCRDDEGRRRHRRRPGDVVGRVRGQGRRRHRRATSQARLDALELDQLGHPHLHLRHHRAAQGRHADPRQPGVDGIPRGRPPSGSSSSDSNISYLPLSHIAEQMFTIHIPTTVGSRRLLRRVDR